MNVCSQLNSPTISISFFSLSFYLCLSRLLLKTNSSDIVSLTFPLPSDFSSSNCLRHGKLPEAEMFREGITIAFVVQRHGK